MKKKWRITFGDVEEMQNFDWAEIRKVMCDVDNPRKVSHIDLEEIKYDSKEEAEKVLDEISDYSDLSVVDIDNIQLFESMYEYCKDADISNYKLTTNKEVADWENEFQLINEFEADNKEYLIDSFKPIDDIHFNFDNQEQVKFDNKTYNYVGWGEPEDCYLLEGEEQTELYTFYRKVDDNEFESCGIVFENREEAKKYVLNEIIEEIENDIEYSRKQGKEEVAKELEDELNTIKDQLKEEVNEIDKGRINI